MGVNNTLYDRPDLDQQVGRLPALYVSGVLPEYRLLKAYEGRLAIHGAVGACRAERVNGTLPPGSVVRVDNATHEVVVSWPAYQTQTFTLPNGDFEDGPGAWKCGPGWSVTQNGDPQSGSWCAEFGEGVSGVSKLDSPDYPVVPGTPMSLSVGVQQGASSSRSLGMRAVIVWLDADHRLLTIPGIQEPANGVWTAGNLVDLGSGGAYQSSSVSTTVPSAAVYARASVSVKRTRENRAAWADDVVWTFQITAVGVRTPHFYDITVRVHDAAGRVADWSGWIGDYAVYATSQLYGLEAHESLAVTGGSLQRLYARPPVKGDDQAMIAGGKLVALTMTRTVSYGEYDQPQDDADSPVITGGSLQALTMTVTVSYGTYNAPQDDADSPVITGGSLQALSMKVTTGYQTYPWPQDDADSPVITGGRLVSLSMTPAT